MSQVKCYTKQKKDGGEYTTCVDKDGNQLRKGEKPKQRFKIKRKRPAKQLLPAEKATGKSMQELRELDPLELMGFLPKEIRQKILDPSETGVKVGARDFAGEYIEQINELRRGQTEYNYYKILGRKTKGRAKGKYELLRVNRFGENISYLDPKSNYVTQQDLLDIAEGRSDIIEKRDRRIEKTIFPARRLDIKTMGDERDYDMEGGLRATGRDAYGGATEYENQIDDISDLVEKMAKLVFDYEMSKQYTWGRKRDFMMSLRKGKDSVFKRFSVKGLFGREDDYDRIFKKEFSFQLVANDNKRYPIKFELVLGLDRDVDNDYKSLDYELIKAYADNEEELAEIDKALDAKNSRFFLLTPKRGQWEFLSYEELEKKTLFVSEKNIKKFLTRE